MARDEIFREALEAAEKAIRTAQRIPKQGYVFDDACADALEKIEAAYASLQEPGDPGN